MDGKEVVYKTPREAEKAGIVYISHRMEEIFELCDRITVLRDGEYVGTRNICDISMDDIVQMMIGREIGERYPKRDAKIGDEVLRIEHLTHKKDFSDVSFSVRAGEVLGVAGLMGAGRTEIMHSVFGNNHYEKGDIYIEGKKCVIKSPAQAIEEFRIKCFSEQQECNNLSGGNQQKVIFGKWLERSPSVFMMDDPTRGIDVGAKYEIYELIINMAKQGKTIIVVSSEMPEILGITNRIGVMSNGRLAGIVNTKETNQEELLRLSAKYL